MNNEIIDMLVHPFNHKWTVQGLGMMRTYLDETRRLHIWHSALKVPGATPLHDHPWDFTSEIIFGNMNQNRFEIVEGETSLHPVPMMKQKIQCGEGGDMVGEPEEVRLVAKPMETYYEGQWYSQEAHEIHDTFPMDNTITIINRVYHENRDFANVYYAKGGEFVSAHPRPASPAEVLFITREVLRAYQASGSSSSGIFRPA